MGKSMALGNKSSFDIGSADSARATVTNALTPSHTMFSALSHTFGELFSKWIKPSSEKEFDTEAAPKATVKVEPIISKPVIIPTKTQAITQHIPANRHTVIQCEAMDMEQLP